MPHLYCHSCQAEFAVPSNTGECPACGGGFVEELAAPSPPQEQQGRRSGQQQGAAGDGTFTRTFTLPGGGRGTVVVSSGPGFAFPGFGMPAGYAGMPGQGGHGGGLAGMPGGRPGGAAGGYPMGGHDDFLNGVLEAMMRGGFLHPGMGGAPHGGGPGAFAGAGGGPGEQEWLDQLMSQIMADYQPPTQAASRRAVRGLPLLAVRAKEAQGEPGEGQAVARAGEPCSVCHDEFQEGEDVLELPCNHGYHKDCLLPWLETHNTCPVCRFELPAEDPGVEARRRQRAEAAASAGAGRAGRASSSRQGRQAAAAAGGGAGGGGTNRLADLLQSISQTWDSFRSGQSQEGTPEAPSPAAGPSGSAAAGGGSSRWGAGGAQASVQSGSWGGAGGGAGGSGSRAAAWGGPDQPHHAQQAQQEDAQAAPPQTSSWSTGRASLRNRREAAAAAAERRLRGESAGDLDGASSDAVAGSAQHQASWGGHQPAPPAPASQSWGQQQQQQQQPLPPHPAAAHSSGWGNPPPLEEHAPEAEHRTGGDSEGAVALGALAGGVLGALAGGALMLLGGRRRRDNA